MKLPESSFKRYLIYSQAMLYLTFIVCIAVAPASLGDNSGFSYFGHHRATVIPFGAGLLATAYLLIKAAWLAPPSLSKIISYSFKIVAPLIAGVVVVPAIGNGLFDLFHRIFGSLLFVTQLGLSFWLVWQARASWLDWALVSLQTAGGVIALIYLSPAHGFELQGQLLFQMAFSAILLRSLVGRPSRLSFRA